MLIVCLQIGLYVFFHERAYWITPPGHVYTMPHVDAYYSDVIRQSKLGAWAHTYSLTTLPTPKIYTYLFFIAAGKIAAVFNIDPSAMYGILQTTGAILLFISVYMLISVMVPAAIQIPALLLTLMFETGPVWKNLLRTPVAEWTTTWFLPAMLSQHFGLAHHLWSQAMGFTVIYLIIRSVHKSAWYTRMFILLLSVAGVLTEPGIFVVIIACVFPVWIIYAIVTKTVKKTIIPIGISIFGIGAAAIFTKQQFAVGLPWSVVVSVEKTWWTTEYILLPFIQSFSFYYPMVAALLILIPFSWKRWSDTVRRTFILTAAWSFMPVGLIYLSAIPWIPLVNGRIASSVTSVPIGILSALVLYAAGKTEYFRHPVRMGVTVLFSVCFGVSLFFSVSYFNQLIAAQNIETYKWNVYMTDNVWNSMMAFKKVPVWSHVMVLPSIGDILTTYAPVHVYQAFPHEGDVNWTKQRGLSHIFYTGKMPRKQLNKLFKENNISYVYYGPEERLATVTDDFYPDILDVFFTNPEVTIYKVRTLPE